MRMFWSTCPQCLQAFVVSYELRHTTTHQLICPYCNNHYPPDQSAAIDERTN